MLIVSEDNKKLKLALSLKEHKFREKEGAYLLEGPNLVREVLQFGGALRFVFAKASHSTEEVNQIVSLAESEGVAVYELPENLFAKLSDTQNSQGIIAVVEQPASGKDEFFEKTEGGMLLVLDRIQDPGNMGTLFRTAEAAGFAGVVLLKGCADVYAPKTVRSAAGSIQRLPKLFASSEEACDMLKLKGYKLCAASMEGENCFKTKFDPKTAIVIGNEGNGVSNEIIKSADKIISIPMAGHIESLNAGLAGGIIMYQALQNKKE